MVTPLRLVSFTDIHSAELLALEERTDAYAEDSTSEQTRRLYRSCWKQFVAWCEAVGLPYLPSSGEIVSKYLTYLADEGLSMSTIDQTMAGIVWFHQQAGYESPRHHPRVRKVVRGIRRKIGVASKGKLPVMIDHLKVMIEHLRPGATGVRDRALLTLGFAGAFRRSEVIALNVEDLKFTTEGLEVIIRRSKTDQEGKGRKIGIPYGSTPTLCPLRAVRAWLDLAKIETGSIFRRIDRHGNISDKRLTSQTVALVIKYYAGLAGLDVKQYSGHSLRVGFVTVAFRAGKHEHSIMMQTGHKSTMMLRRYIRDGTLFEDNAAAGLL